MKFKSIVFLLGILIVLKTSAQKSDTSKAFFSIHAYYGAFTPGGDMKTRFGWNSEVGAGVIYKTRTNWLFDIEGGFIFGDNFKQENTYFSSIETADGSIIGEDGQYVLYKIYERGFKIPTIKVGKLFPVKISNGNANSGFYIMAGTGFLQHKIKIYDEHKTFSHIQGDYIKGYDKLTNGLMLTENFGYMYYGKKKRINFYLAFEFNQGFTQNRRSYNFDSKSAENEPRLDLLSGIKLGLTIPLYKVMADEYYYR